MHVYRMRQRAARIALQTPMQGNDTTSLTALASYRGVVDNAEKRSAPLSTAKVVAEPASKPAPRLHASILKGGLADPWSAGEELVSPWMVVSRRTLEHVSHSGPSECTRTRSSSGPSGMTRSVDLE